MFDGYLQTVSVAITICKYYLSGVKMLLPNKPWITSLLSLRTAHFSRERVPKGREVLQGQVPPRLHEEQRCHRSGENQGAHRKRGVRHERAGSSLHAEEVQGSQEAVL